MIARISFGLILTIFVALLFMVGCDGSDQAEIEATVQKDLQSVATKDVGQTGSDSYGYGTNVATANVRERFVLKDIDGKTRRWSEFAGRPVVINFWATWCGPCRREIPTMKNLYAEYKQRGMEIISISVDGPKSLSSVPGFVQQMQMPWVVVYGDQQSALEFELGRGIPMTVFYNAEGNETGRFTGAQPEAKFREEFDKMF